MNQKKITDGSMEILRRKLAGFKVAVSPSYSDLTLEHLLADVQDCHIIKKNNRRRVFYLKTSQGSYFLKFSTLLRGKDQLRHFLLPGRRWAEWLNLHRLRKAHIAAASPVMKGESEDSSSKGFFILTEKVCGTPFQTSVTDAGKFGEYMALLHSRGIYHIDLHPDNIIVQPDGQFCLIDVQEVYFLPWLPRRLRIHNLGKIFSGIDTQIVPESWSADFLAGYNLNQRSPVYVSELVRAAERHQQRRFRSRGRRCCKNSTEFAIVKQKDLRGYRRRDFKWGLTELREALDKGTLLKGEHVFAYQGVCIKKHTGGIFRRDRCLISWKMSRALEVRSLLVPRSLGYYINHRTRYFISEFLAGSAHLNDYLSSLADESLKRKALKKLALWLKKIHGLNIWQRDFKSSNILVRNGDYFMVDLDGVKIRRLSHHHKIVNLSQLNASLSNTVTVRDRLRFFYHYSADKRPSRRQRRAVYRAVWEITTKKNTLNYNLDLAKLKI